MRRVVASFLVFAFLCSAAFAADKSDNESGLPLPRFVSLRSGEVNMRMGPGLRYPIAWFYTRRGLPIEITAEYDIWRRVRDPDGVEGWISKVELTGKRSAIATGSPRDLREHDDDAAQVVAHLDVGAIGQLEECSKDWCKIKFDGAKGYLRKTEFWGAYPDEVFD